ncbi:hypothetical protein Pan241w_09870 [Gimesia alba]|uniref:Uncharacterized protein n=1 Tax=Gimesia alba TaxID=2527973 RepID=A0A517RAN3_9PLAN|nr:hypothetical protein [Gimesia alba]QDT40928.1 hypothetical protein Pan241w_09870 [Gimesia alba]
MFKMLKSKWLVFFGEQITKHDPKRSDNTLLLSANLLFAILLILELGSREIISVPVETLLLITIGTILYILSQATRIARKKRPQLQSEISEAKNSRINFTNKSTFIQSVILFVSLFTLASLKFFVPNILKIEIPKLHDGIVSSLDHEDYDIILKNGDQTLFLFVNSMFRKNMKQVQLGDVVRFSYSDHQLIAIYKKNQPIFTFDDYLLASKAMERRLGIFFL